MDANNSLSMYPKYFIIDICEYSFFFINWCKFSKSFTVFCHMYNSRQVNIATTCHCFNSLSLYLGKKNTRSRNSSMLSWIYNNVLYCKRHSWRTSIICLSLLTLAHIAKILLKLSRKLDIIFERIIHLEISLLRSLRDNTIRWIFRIWKLMSME